MCVEIGLIVLSIGDLVFFFVSCSPDIFMDMALIHS